jgi:hypothetical protein
MNSPLLSGLSSKQLRRAAAIKEKIAKLEKELGQLLGSGSGSTAAATPRKGRKLSAAGRARIVAAAKARWARIKSAKR